MLKDVLSSWAIQNMGWNGFGPEVYFVDPWTIGRISRGRKDLRFWLCSTSFTYSTPMLWLLALLCVSYVLSSGLVTVFQYFHISKSKWILNYSRHISKSKWTLNKLQQAVPLFLWLLFHIICLETVSKSISSIFSMHSFIIKDYIHL